MDELSGQRGGPSGEQAPDGQPERIGPYRVLGMLGEGGMGVVYHAEQATPVRRDVALKIIKLGMDTRQVVTRFETERQALAVMDHPSIAKVFDAGATESGRPYFAMELVRGVPLTRYCDERQLGIAERVRLFAHICRAVQHAHQKGVIHRDLKPSNVLVTEADGRPLPKIIDFGVARATATAEGDTTRLTHLDELVGTPAYMSPEQIDGAGRDIDTRSDIYALGVMLYELLTGALPVEQSRLRGWALYAQSLTLEPPAPSARVTQLGANAAAMAAARSTDVSGLRRTLKGDLDWIVLRALEKDRERRYDTANGFALDLERYLAHEPVLARSPSRSYRMGKFVRRHRAGVAFAVVVVLLLTGFGVVQTIQAENIRKARDTADARRHQAEQLIDFMLVDLRDKLTPLGRLDVLDDVGAQALGYFAALPEDEFTDAELQSRSRALYQIGEVRLNEGNAADATAAFRASLRLAVELSARAPDDPERLFGLSQSHFWLGYAAWQNRELDAAEPEFRSYLQIAERLVAMQPDNDAYRMELGYAHSNLGSLAEARGDLQAAADAFRTTLDAKRALVERNPDNIDWLGELAETHNTLAVVYRRMGEYRDARAEHERELEIKGRIRELAPEHAYWRFRYAVGLNFAAIPDLALGDVKRATDRLATAVAILDSLLLHDPANVGWRREAAHVHRRLGNALALAGQQNGAARAMSRAERLFDEVIRTDSAGFNWRAALVSLHTDHARTLLVAGDAASAEREILRAQLRVAEQDTTSRARQRDALEASLVLGHVLGALGRQDSARTVFSAAVPRARRLTDGTGGEEFLPLLAEALTGAHDLDDARGVIARLEQRGYAEPFLMSVLRHAGLSTPR